jgi:hypothetical protein
VSRDGVQRLWARHLGLARNRQAWVKLGGMIAIATVLAAWVSAGPLLADGSLLVGTASHGQAMVGASSGGLDAYRTIAVATGASNRLWLFVGDGTQGTSVPIGVYDDAGGRLLSSCEIVPAESLPAWSSCTSSRAVQTTAGHTYWLAIGHASNRVIWWAEPGALCESRSIFLRSSALPDPFPMAQSNCADDGSKVALYLGDAPPPAEVHNSPTLVPTATSAAESPASSTSVCLQVTVNGAPGGTVDVQTLTGACPSPAPNTEEATQGPGQDSTTPPTATDGPPPASPGGDAADQSQDPGEP